jgi:drug/metabolite transporter (DMT)-like permease
VAEEPLNRNDDHLFLKVVQVASAVGLGAMSAFLLALKQVNPHVRFEFSFTVGLAFLGGVAFSWCFWRLAFSLSAGTPNRVRIFKALGLLLALGTALPFGLALRNVSNERISDVAVGTGLAIAVLCVVGILLWRVGRFFEDAE